MTMLPMGEMDPIFSQQIDIPKPTNRGGMFGGGKFGLKEALAFGLAGLVSRRNPALLQGLMGAVMQRQKQAQEDAQYQQRRGDELADYGKKLELQAQYKTPPINDTVADYQFIMQQLGPEAGKRFLETKTNPIVMTPYGPMPYSAVNGGSQQVSSPVGKLTPIEDGGPRPLGAGGFPSVGY